MSADWQRSYKADPFLLGEVIGLSCDLVERIVARHNSVHAINVHFMQESRPANKARRITIEILEVTRNQTVVVHIARKCVLREWHNDRCELIVLQQEANEWASKWIGPAKPNELSQVIADTRNP